MGNPSTKKKKKILIVSNDKANLHTWTTAEEFDDNRVAVIVASSVDEAREKFATNPDVALIVMDILEDEITTTLALVKDFRETFKGPIVAASLRTDYRKELMRAGCDQESAPYPLPGKVLDILKLK